MERIEALASYLEVEVEEVTQLSNDMFSVGNADYLILTDDDADTLVSKNIREELWAFNTNFIVSHSDDSFTDRAIRAISKMQEELCEDANEIIYALIGGTAEDFTDFVDDAVAADGRGHFLSSYDGEENYFEDSDGDEWYIYRTN